MIICIIFKHLRKGVFFKQSAQKKSPATDSTSIEAPRILRKRFSNFFVFFFERGKVFSKKGFISVFFVFEAKRVASAGLGEDLGCVDFN